MLLRVHISTRGCTRTREQVRLRLHICQPMRQHHHRSPSSPPWPLVTVTCRSHFSPLINHSVHMTECAWDTLARSLFYMCEALRPIVCYSCIIHYYSTLRSQTRRYLLSEGSPRDVISRAVHEGSNVAQRFLKKFCTGLQKQKRSWHNPERAGIHITSKEITVAFGLGAQFLLLLIPTLISSLDG